MNLSELLTSPKPAGGIAPGKGNPQEANAQDGEAFSNSVNALNKDGVSAKGELTQQTGQEPSENLPPNEDALPQQTNADAKTDETLSVASNFTAPSQPVSQSRSLQTMLPSMALQTESAGKAAFAQAGQPDMDASIRSRTKTVSESVRPTVNLPQLSSEQAIATKGEIKLVSPQSTAAEPTSGDAQNLIDKLATKAERAGAGPVVAASAKPSAYGQDQHLNISQSLPQPAQIQEQERLASQSAVGAIQSARESAKNTKLADVQAADGTRSAEQKGDAKAAPQAVTDELADADGKEQRRIDQKDDTAAADLKAEVKRSDRNAAIPQPLTQNLVATARIGSPVVSGVDFGQTTISTTATSVATAATPSPTMAGDRSFAISTAAATASADATARETISQIAAAIRNKPLMHTVELSLDPPELGRVEIQMEMAEVGLKATLSAERSVTGDLIRRQSELLLQQLTDAGFSDVDIDFQDFGSGKQKQGDSDQDAISGSPNEPSGPSADLAAAPRVRQQLGTSGMDVRL